jgi:hypothetical protein
MDFDIQPNQRLVDDHQTIRLPQKMREGMELLVGQFMQVRGRETLVLQIGGNLDVFHECAYVSPDNFDKIKGSDAAVEFRILDVTLGCDPEFFILWKKQLISAATYLPFSGQIGADGNLGELRPMYARHEDDVVRNIAQMIPQIKGKMKRSTWAKGFPANGDPFEIEAHSYHHGLAAGYHVHMGIPPEILNTRKEFSRIAMNHLVKCLDWYVSVPLVPLEVNSQRRLGATSYGKPGDYRPSNLTLEYRTPGGFYLRTPTLARGMMGLCLMVAENVVSRMKAASKNFSKLNKLTPADLHEIMPIPEAEEIKGVLLSKEPYTAQSHMESIQKELGTLPTYGKHQQAVEDFFSEVGTGRVPGPNLINNWKVDNDGE